VIASYDPLDRTHNPTYTVNSTKKPIVKGIQMRNGIRLLAMCGAGLAVVIAIVALFMSKGEVTALSTAMHDPRLEEPSTESTESTESTKLITSPQIASSGELTIYLSLVTRNFCLPPGLLWNPDLETDFCYLHDYQRWDGVSGFVAPYWRPL